jgi:hypothetical protein
MIRQGSIIAVVSVIFINLCIDSLVLKKHPLRFEVLPVMLLKIEFFWDVTLCCWDCLTLADEDTIFLQNVRDHLPSGTASHPRRPDSLKVPS